MATQITDQTTHTGDIELRSIDGTRDYEQPNVMGYNYIFNGRHGKINARDGNFNDDRYDLVNSFIELRNFDLYDHLGDNVDTLVLESRFSNTSAIGKFVLVKDNNTYFFDMDNSTHTVVSAAKIPGQTIDFTSYWGGSNYLTRDPHADDPHNKDDVLGKRWVQYTESDAAQVAKIIDDHIEHGGVLRNSLPQTIANAENKANANAEKNAGSGLMSDPLKDLNQDGKVLGQAFTTFASDGSISPQDEQKIADIGNVLKDAKIQIAPDKGSALVFNNTPDLNTARLQVPKNTR